MMLLLDLVEASRAGNYLEMEESGGLATASQASACLLATKANIVHKDLSCRQRNLWLTKYYWVRAWQNNHFGRVLIVPNSVLFGAN